MTASSSRNQRNTRGHRPRLQIGGGKETACPRLSNPAGLHPSKLSLPDSVRLQACNHDSPCDSSQPAESNTANQLGIVGSTRALKTYEVLICFTYLLQSRCCPATTQPCGKRACRNF